MKSQIQEITAQTSTQEKKSKKPEQRLGVKFFYEIFKSEKKSYAVSRFSNLKKGKKPLPYSLYRKIIKEYFNVYLNEFYYFNDAVYFPFGGLLKKVLYNKWTDEKIKPNTNRKEKEYRHIGNTIGFFWYLRPSKKMYYMVRIKKLKGSTSSLVKIEKNYLKSANKDIIPIFVEEIKKGTKHRNLFRNI